jgi:hypothetical protein
MTTCFFRYLLSSFYCVAHRSKCHVKGKERILCRVLISALADICLRRYIKKTCQGYGELSLKIEEQGVSFLTLFPNLPGKEPQIKF